VVAIEVNEQSLRAWCRDRLGSPPRETLFSSGNLSRVIGLRLTDEREVVVKVRPPEARLTDCAAVQLHMWRSGFPCPRPLAGPHPLGPYAASAEALMPGGGPLAAGDAAATCFASLLARFIRTAPPARTVPNLTPTPAWMRWYHDGPGVWPPPDDRPDDLNTHQETAWLDEIGAHVRRRLAPLRDADRVIGHCDWEAHNIQWRDGEAWAVHDWDSVVAEPETVIVGEAAAMWPASAESFGASLEQTEAFLDGYQRARGRAFTPDELQQTWAAGLWVRSFNGKKFLLDGLDTLGPTEAAERLRRATSS
jgi:Ser/Thr protein kinase RdoA (MazF antagonist)